MSKQNLSFHVGDQVIHLVYGLGEIIQLDEKVLSGRTSQYYVVQVRDLTLWVPIKDSGQNSLRFPTPAKEFQKLFRLLSGPGEELSSDRITRKTQLGDLLNDGSLESICRVVRDLMLFKQTKRLNEYDTSILKRAQNLLLVEWSAALSVPVRQAESELNELLAAHVI